MKIWIEDGRTVPGVDGFDDLLHVRFHNDLPVVIILLFPRHLGYLCPRLRIGGKKFFAAAAYGPGLYKQLKSKSPTDKVISSLPVGLCKFYIVIS